MNEQSRIEYLTGRAELEQKRVATLETENAALQSELLRAQQKVAALEPALTAAEEELAHRERDVRDLKRSICDLRSQRVYLRSLTGLRCHSGSDGECNWADCPQNREGEPAKSGRSCPLFDWDDQEGRAGG